MVRERRSSWRPCPTAGPAGASGRTSARSTGDLDGSAARTARVSLVEQLLVTPGEPAQLAERDPRGRLELAGRTEAETLTSGLGDELRELQARLWAEDRRSLLLVLQGLDTAGKDSTIRRVFSGLNPLACRVISFKPPSEDDLDHDYLRRVHAACPARGEIGIFNRSHYEDVGVVRVKELVSDKTWRRRY